MNSKQARSKWGCWNDVASATAASAFSPNPNCPLYSATIAKNIESTKNTKAHEETPKERSADERRLAQITIKSGQPQEGTKSTKRGHSLLRLLRIFAAISLR